MGMEKQNKPEKKHFGVGLSLSLSLSLQHFLEVVCHCFFFPEGKDWVKVTQGHPSSFMSKVELELFWFLAWWLNFYTKLAL